MAARLDLAPSPAPGSLLPVDGGKRVRAAYIVRLRWPNLASRAARGCCFLNQLRAARDETTVAQWGNIGVRRPSSASGGRRLVSEPDSRCAEGESGQLPIQDLL